MPFAGILHTNLDVLIQTHMYDLLICIILQSGIFPSYSYVVGKNMMEYVGSSLAQMYSLNHLASPTNVK
jgi:hypothetical protein